MTELQISKPAESTQLRRARLCTIWPSHTLTYRRLPCRIQTIPPRRPLRICGCTAARTLARRTFSVDARGPFSCRAFYLEIAICERAPHLYGEFGLRRLFARRANHFHFVAPGGLRARDDDFLTLQHEHHAVQFAVRAFLEQPRARARPLASSRAFERTHSRAPPL